MIKIHKKNEVHLKIKTDPSIMQEISDYFTFTVPNAKFHPKFKARIWDGKIRLANSLTGELPVGLLEHLKHFAKNNEYQIDLSDYADVHESLTIDELRDFCENVLKLSSNGSLIQIRDYQLLAIHTAIDKGRTILLSPTGSGKSLIIYCLMRWHMMRFRRQLIIVPTTSLVEQLKSDFEDYSTINGWSSKNIAVVYSGHEKVNNVPVVISTWQSIYKMPKEFFASFDVIYGDEAHLFKAKSLLSIFDKCVNVKYRIGTTGTLDGTQTHKLVLEGMFGPVFSVTTTKELIDAKQLADLKIMCINLLHKTSTKKMTYEEEMKYLISHEKRNKFLKNLSLSQKGNTLLLFQFVEKHGKILFEMLSQNSDTDKKIYFVHGQVDSLERENIRKIVENEENSIIVASVGTFSTGVNLKNLHNIIFASPTKSRIRTLQSIGRGLRTSDTKFKCKVFDISDDLGWKGKKNTTLLHAIERIKIYAEEQLDYKLLKVDL